MYISIVSILIALCIKTMWSLYISHTAPNNSSAWPLSYCLNGTAYFSLMVSKLAAKGWYNSHHTPEQNQTKVTFLPTEMWEYFKSIILKNNEQFSSVYNAAGLI